MNGALARWESRATDSLTVNYISYPNQPANWLFLAYVIFPIYLSCLGAVRPYRHVWESGARPLLELVERTLHTRDENTKRPKEAAIPEAWGAWGLGPKNRTNGYGSKLYHQDMDRRLWSIPLSSVLFGVPIFDPQPHVDAEALGAFESLS